MEMELPDSLRSKIISLLLADSDNLEADLTAFNEKYLAFLTQDEATVRIILRSHLIVEHFLDIYLAAAFPTVIDWDDAQFSFRHKLCLANNCSWMVVLMPGLRCLNKLRNKLVHNLEAVLTEEDTAPIRDFVTMYRRAANEPVPRGLGLVQDFAMLASAWMQAQASSIERHALGRGLVGLQEWWDDKLTTAPEDRDTTSRDS